MHTNEKPPIPTRPAPNVTKLGYGTSTAFADRMAAWVLGTFVFLILVTIGGAWFKWFWLGWVMYSGC